MSVLGEVFGMMILTGLLRFLLTAVVFEKIQFSMQICFKLGNLTNNSGKASGLIQERLNLSVVTT